MAAGFNPLGDPVELPVDVFAGRVRAKPEVVGQVGETCTGRVLLVDQEIPIGEGRRQRSNCVDDVGLLEGNMT